MGEDKIIEEPVSFLENSLSASLLSDDDAEKAASEKKHHPFRNEEEQPIIIAQLESNAKSPHRTKDNQSPQEKKTIIVEVKTPDKHIFSEEP